MKRFKFKKKQDLTKKERIIRRVILIVIIIAVVILGLRFILQKAFGGMMDNYNASQYTTEAAQKRTIENHLSSTGTAQPLNTYTVTTVSTVEGTIIAADFEEGDLVDKGDILYKISTDSMESTLSSARKTLERAEKKYKRAVADYKEEKGDTSSLLIEANASGYVKSLNVEVGDDVQMGSMVAQIYDNKYMLLRVPFNSADVGKSLIGKKASVELSETGESLSGTVTEVGSVDETLSGNRVVRYVTIKVKNPGGLTASTTATANIGNLYCNDEGTFSITEDTTVTSSLTGEVSKIFVKEGNWVEKGDTLLRLTSDTVDNQIEALSDQVDSAQQAVEDAQTRLDDVLDNITDYTITSPITGTIIEKNFKVGDTLNASSMNSSLCLIYDLSAMTFDMYVDELDVHAVEVGQTVKITADAIEGQNFEGVITNISLVSTTSGGVTQYPVTVRINEPGDLLPGMNISGEIVIEAVQNVISVPADSLQRGNVVYVQDDSVTEAVGDVPVGFRSVEVTTGVSDDEYVEITSGIAEGDVVYVPARQANFGVDFMMGNQGQQGDFEQSAPSQGAPDGNMGGQRSGGGNNGGGFQN